MKRKKVLLDINIILDLLLAREPFAVVAREIFQKAINEEIEIYVTNCSINTLVYFIEKTVGHEATRQIINDFLQIAKGIDITINDIQKAFLNTDITDTEDAIQIQGAIKANIDFLLTRDKKFAKIKTTQVTVITPEDFLNLIRG